MQPTLFTPRDPDYLERVRASFARQRIMQTIGATLEEVTPGSVKVALAFRDDLVQQHGYLHAGIVTAVVDTACGYAALSLMSKSFEVLTVEYKVNFLAPAVGSRFIAHGWVIKAGKTISVCSGEVFAEVGSSVKSVVSIMATMMAIVTPAGS